MLIGVCVDPIVSYDQGTPLDYSTDLIFQCLHHRLVIDRPVASDENTEIPFQIPEFIYYILVYNSVLCLVRPCCCLAIYVCVCVFRTLVP